jgi:hypothetical protein
MAKKTKGVQEDEKLKRANGTGKKVDKGANADVSTKAGKKANKSKAEDSVPGWDGFEAKDPSEFNVKDMRSKKDNDEDEQRVKAVTNALKVLGVIVADKPDDIGMYIGKIGGSVVLSIGSKDKKDLSKMENKLCAILYDVMTHIPAEQARFIFSAFNRACLLAAAKDTKLKEVGAQQMDKMLEALFESAKDQIEKMGADIRPGAKRSKESADN